MDLPSIPTAVAYYHDITYLRGEIKVTLRDFIDFVDNASVGKREPVNFRWSNYKDLMVEAQEVDVIGSPVEVLLRSQTKAYKMEVGLIERVNPLTKNTQPVSYRSTSVFGSYKDVLAFAGGQGQTYIVLRRYMSTTEPQHQIVRLLRIIRPEEELALADGETIDANDYAECEILTESPYVPIPPSPKFESLVKKHADAYQKGERCIQHGFGLGAVAYFRRLVEDCLIDLIDGVLSSLPEEDEASRQILNDAKSQPQFDTRMKTLRSFDWPAFSSAYKGHNPIALLFSLTSENLHSESEDKCLEVATQIRTVLIDVLAQVQAHIDSREAVKAVSKLMDKDNA